MGRKEKLRKNEKPGKEQKKKSDESPNIGTTTPLHPLPITTTIVIVDVIVTLTILETEIIDGLTEIAQTAHGLGLNHPKGEKRRRTTPVKIKIIEEGMTQRGGLSMRVLKRMKETGGPMDPMDTGRVIIVMTVSASGSGMTTSLLPDIFLTIIQLLTFGHHRHLHFLQQLL